MGIYGRRNSIMGIYGKKISRMTICGKKKTSGMGIWGIRNSKMRF